MNEEKLCRRCDEPVEDRIPGCPLQCGTDKCSSYKKKKHIDYSKIPIIWVIGGPGSGRRELCVKIREKFGYTLLSTGMMLREEVDRATDRSKCLSTVLEHGTLAPLDLVLGLLRESMEARVHDAKGFLVEGYPRIMRQGIMFERTIGPANALIYLEAPREVLERRLKSQPWPATITDAVEMQNFINTRLKFFFDNHKLILAQFPNIVYKVDAEKPADEIFGIVSEAINNTVLQMKKREEETQKENERWAGKI